MREQIQPLFWDMDTRHRNSDYDVGIEATSSDTLLDLAFASFWAIVSCVGAYIILSVISRLSCIPKPSSAGTHPVRLSIENQRRGKLSQRYPWTLAQALSFGLTTRSGVEHCVVSEIS